MSVPKYSIEAKNNEKSKRKLTDFTQKKKETKIA